MKLNDYYNLLNSKRFIFESQGIEVNKDELPEILFDFQRDIVQHALKKGRFAVFAKFGLGKTLIQLSWANLIHRYTGKDILILAPLAVSYQTHREARDKLNIDIHLCRRHEDIRPGINITNYEMLEHFNPESFIGIVLDESSILKAYSGTRKKQILAAFENTPYKLACTATPSPNDHMELLNHAEFLNVMKSSEALANWFINDSMKTGKYRLKKHAEKDFWRWVSTWAVSLNKPSDLDYENNGFNLPALNIHEEIIQVDIAQETGDKLFRIPDLSATSYHHEKRLTAENRAKRAAEIIYNREEEQCIIWCEMNYEADILKKILPEAIEIRGNHSPEHKERSALDFIDGKIRYLITKPRIFGYGLNFQNCHRQIFCGMSFSFEAYYQALHRLWRFGQKNPVDTYVIVGETERQILNTVHQKQKHHDTLVENMTAIMREYSSIHNQQRHRKDYDPQIDMRLPRWLKTLEFKFKERESL